MIAFDLQCAKGHRFEGWFEDSDTFDEQSGKGLVACPVCNDNLVIRVPSTFAIRSTRTLPVPAAKPSSPQIDPQVLSHRIRRFVTENFDDVGCDFAREALKMHYGVEEPRNIRGVSTREEEETLEKEGVEFLKVPVPAPPETDG